jgi:hypothetical protein
VRDLSAVLAFFSSVSMCENSSFSTVMQQLPRTGTHDRVRRHQLRMRKTLVDVLVDDVGVIQDEIAINQHRHAVVGIDDRNVLGLLNRSTSMT